MVEKKHMFCLEAMTLYGAKRAGLHHLLLPDSLELRSWSTANVRDTAGNINSAAFSFSADCQNTAVNKNFSAVILDTA